MKKNTKNHINQVEENKVEIFEFEQSETQLDKVQEKNTTLKNNVIESLKKTMNSKLDKKKDLETNQPLIKKTSTVKMEEKKKKGVNTPELLESDVQDDDGNNNFQHPSDVLREERIRQNLTQREVALQLKVTSTKINDIESKNFEAIKSAVFLQGYFKLYAELLNLDSVKIEQNLVKILYDFQKSKKKKNSQTQISREPSQGRKTLLMNTANINGYDKNYFMIAKKGNYVFFVMLIFLLSAIIYYFINNLSEEKKENKEVLTIPITAEQDNKKAFLTDENKNEPVEVKINLVNFSQNDSDENTKIEPIKTKESESIKPSIIATIQIADIVTIEDNSNVQNELPEKQKIVSNTNQYENAIESVRAENVVEVKLPSSNTISLFFIDDSWIEVIDGYSERIIYSKLYKKGEKVFVPRYNRKLKFTFGKASGIKMYVGEKLFDLRTFTNTLDIARFNLTF